MADDTSAPRNRRERRAAAKADGTLKSTKSSSSDYLHSRLPNIEYKKPDFDAPREPGHKTLYEIAAERQKQLEKEGFYDKYDDKYAYGENAGDHQFWTTDGDEPIGAVGEASLWSVSLAMFHFTLDVLVFHQYRQSIEWREIIVRMLTMLPALWVVIYIMHTRRVLAWKRTRQVFFFAASVGVGCELIRNGNKAGYFAVMKTAPPLGTVWIWSVVEMDLWFAVAHVLVVVGYMWWNGFKNF
jgi:hypothetical protein